MALAKRREKLRHLLGVERERGRKLHEQRPHSSAEAASLVEKHVEQDVAGDEPLIVRDRSRQLDGESKIRRHTRGPALVHRAPMQPVERRVDLDRAETGGISLEVAPFAREPISPESRQSPASRPHTQCRTEPHCLSHAFARFVRSCACGASVAIVVPALGGISPCARRGAMLTCLEFPARTSPLPSRPVSLTSRTALLLSAALATLPFAAQAQAPRSTAPAISRALPPDAPLPFDTSVLRGTLPNGIHYLVRHNTKPENRAELRLAVNAGSILESDRQLGVAHFGEHMAFNGTRRFPKASLINFLERVGVKFGPDLNAYTSFDETVYMLRIPTDTAAIVNTALDILEDWATGLAFD